MGYVVGAIVGLILAGITGQFLLHNFQAGLAPGLALALWIGTAINHDAKEEKLNMLFPIPLKYPIHVKKAYPEVKKLIREYTYQFGKSFKIHPTNPSQTRELKADMKWTDTDEVAEPTQNDYGKVRKTSVERHIRLEIYFKSPDADSTIVEIRWYPMAEGLNPRACEPVIKEINNSIQQLLGEGKTDLPPKQPWIPPVWLHITTIICIGFYVLAAVGKAGALWEELKPLEDSKTSSEERWQKQLDDFKSEKAQWDKFKSSFKPPSPIEQRSRNEIFLEPQPPPSYQHSKPSILDRIYSPSNKLQNNNLLRNNSILQPSSSPTDSGFSK